MQKKHSFKRFIVSTGKFFRVTFLSYIILCTFLVFFSFTLNYCFLYKQLREEFVDSQNTMISVFKENITVQFKNLDEIASLVRTDPEMLSNIFNSPYNYYKNSQKLLGYVSISNHILDIFVYDEGIDRLYSSIGGVTVKDTHIFITIIFLQLISLIILIMFRKRLYLRFFLLVLTKIGKLQRIAFYILFHSPIHERLSLL